MIRYVGNTDFRELPGAIGPSENEVGLDILVRTFVGRTSLRETVFKPGLYTPDYRYPQLFATSIDATDLAGGLTEYRVTYKGMLSGQPRDPHVRDSIVVKNGSVTANYVYERLETYSGQYIFTTGIGDPLPAINPTWREKSTPIQANVSYYARATSYQYVRRERPLSPQYGNIGVNGYSQAINLFNTAPSGTVQVSKFPTITYSVAYSEAQEPEYNRRLAQIDQIATTPMRFKRIDVGTANRTQICSEFTAVREGLWWVCSETWEVELLPTVPNPEPLT